MATNHAIPDLNNKGLTYKELYKSEERHLNDDENEMRRMWGSKFTGKACYRFKLLKETKKEEFLALYKKIHDRDKVLGGQVPQALAVAFFLHCRGREINWLSFYDHAKSAARSRAIVNNDVEDELGNCGANVAFQVASSPTAQQVDKLSTQNLVYSNLTSNTKVNDGSSAKTMTELSRIVKEWVGVVELDVNKLTLELQVSDGKYNAMKASIKDLEARQARVNNEIKKYEELIAKLSSAAKEGVEAVIDLQKRELEELGLALKQALDELLVLEISRDAKLEQLNKLKLCVMRLLAAQRIMSQPFELTPCLPQTPIVIDSMKADLSIKLKEACPFCQRSLMLDEMLLPIIIVECKHAYHLTCCLTHFSGSSTCCDNNCDYNMSKSWLSLLGLRAYKDNMMLYSHEKVTMDGVGFTPASISYTKEHKLLPRRLSTALTTTKEVNTRDNMSKKAPEDNNADLRTQ